MNIFMYRFQRVKHDGYKHHRIGERIDQRNPQHRENRVCNNPLCSPPRVMVCGISILTTRIFRNWSWSKLAEPLELEDIPSFVVRQRGTSIRVLQADHWHVTRTRGDVVIESLLRRRRVVAAIANTMLGLTAADTATA